MADRNALMPYWEGTKIAANHLLKGAYDNDVVERATVFPLGKYSDGQVRPAWPGLISAPIEGFNRMWERGDEANVANPEALAASSADSFDAAGGAMTGGLAAGMVGAVPEGAVAANGGWLRRMLGRDPEPAVTPARAEIPYDNVPFSGAWHSGPNKFDRFDREFLGTVGGDSGGFYFGPESVSGPNGALTTGMREHAGGVHTYQVDIDPSGANILEYGLPYEAQSPQVQAILDANRSTMAGWPRLASAKDRPLWSGPEPGVPLDKQFDTEGFPRGLDKLGIDIARARDEMMVFDPNRIKIRTRDGEPITSGDPQPAERKGIRAYHGSPHDFDKFDMSKIGTGEGAQAYGHGLYFAENEGVARSYRDQLGDYTNAVEWAGPEPATELQQKLMNQMKGPDAVLGEAMNVDRLMHEKYRVLRMQNQQAEGGMFGIPDPEAAQRAAQTMQEIQELEAMTPNIKFNPPGRMYEVNIGAEPEHFLDWDAPLMDQHESVRNAMEQFRSVPGAEGLWSIRGHLRQGLPGESAVNHLAKLLGGPEHVSAKLKEAGVPGVRYFDQGSRFGGDGKTRNYVVFDDSLVNINRKYANAPTGAAAPLAFTDYDEQPRNALMPPKHHSSTQARSTDGRFSK